MLSSLQRTALGIIFFLATVVGATVGYMLYGWNFLDSFYQVIITVFGVGFGEIRPINTPGLRILTILVIICGTSSAVYAVGGFFQMITEGQINKALASRRMNREIESLRDHVIICGYGRLGQILARKLQESQQPFVVIDNNSDRILQAEEKGYLILEGNAADENILHTAGIQKARYLTTVLPDDALNVFITLTARELNSNLIIIARGELPSTEKKLKLAGANQVILPATIGAERMAQMITHPAAIDFLDEAEGRRNLNELLAQIDLKLEELSITLNSPFVNRPISEMEIGGQGAFVIVAIRQLDGKTVLHPSHSFILQDGDTVILLGHEGDLPQFARRFSMKRTGLTYRGTTF
ncbi:potassium channel protein [Aphanothece hegewaldii CCALA 016]|uniref:Potassium channel protein n=1 Tax=Aphanothece hegewaldii CCALA 016 TaxID=2107694 RepID=A0A2T1LRL8_9CHRO|nr:potassium channel protein [Aphanothece hegewaldii]PSF31380.1 potassium channel protein [Aphanothece hegewaldii CCALA 016]